MTGWIQPAPVASRTEPRLVARADLGALKAYLTGCGVGIDELDVAGAANIAEVIDRMIGVLPVPVWTGNNWDAIFDVTEELCAELTFPHALVIRGYDQLLAARPHDALQLAIRMTQFESELSFRKSQLLVYYEGETWGAHLIVRRFGTRSRQARKAAEGSFYGQLALSPETAMTTEGDRVDDETPLPEPLYLALRDLVAAIVERRYDDLRAASGGRLEIEDLRRRIEEDAGEILTMPPREHYNHKVLMDANAPGAWFFFLDLWGENGEADLHVAGELTELDNGQVIAKLDDIAP